MLLLGRLAKVQGLKGEFLLQAETDEPERMRELPNLLLAPPSEDLSERTGATGNARPVKIRTFRWHQDRPCLSFEGIPDRTAAEPFRSWGLWMPEAEARLNEGESFRHQWEGCEVFVGGAKVGEVLHLEPTPGGYDMVVMRDLRPGRTGRRDIPYVKAWFTLDLDHRRIDLDPPEGLLDLDRA